MWKLTSADLSETTLLSTLVESVKNRTSLKEADCWPIFLLCWQQSRGFYSDRCLTTWPSHVKLAVLTGWEQRWGWQASFFGGRGRCWCHHRCHIRTSCASFLSSRVFSACCSGVRRGRGHTTVTSVAAAGRSTLPEGLWRRGCFIRGRLTGATLCWSRLGVWRSLWRCFLIWEQNQMLNQMLKGSRFVLTMSTMTSTQTFKNRAAADILLYTKTHF